MIPNKFFIVTLSLLFTTIGYSQSDQLKVKQDGIVVPAVGDHDEITSPEDGQLVFDYGYGTFWYYSVTTAQWHEISGDNLGNHNATQNLNLSDHRITNLSTPIIDDDAANKSYVDNHADDDADSSNEIQVMSVSETGDTFYLDGTGFIIIPGISQANYITDADGNVYQEIEILGQVWLEPSLSATKFNDGTPIENPSDINEFYNTNGNSSIPSYMWYDQDSVTYASEYGALYNWFVVDTASNGNKNICPVGYHVPTIEEVSQLRDTLSPTNTSLVGHHLKTVGYDYWLPNGGFGLDTYGFSAKGAGRIGASESQYLHRIMTFLTTTVQGGVNDLVFSGSLNDFQNGLNLSGINKRMGYSIRCLKDDE